MFINKNNYSYYLVLTVALISFSFSSIHCSAQIKNLPGLSLGKDKSKNISSLVDGKIKLGIDVLIEKNLDSIRGKRIGLITNPSGVNNNMVSTIDVLIKDPSLNLTTLFGPEHGVRGDIPAGEYVQNYVDKTTNLPVYSLYGKTRKPTREMLRNIDVLIFDIQDIGVRPYTYIYSMAYAMEAAKESEIDFVVLDRPNPLGGNLVDGNVLDPRYKSFIGLYPIPYVHGMTIGELAWFFNTEFGIGVDLKIIPMEGWTRDMVFEDTGLGWIPTSPHIPNSETAAYYATTGLIGELGTISVGVGYTEPFMLIGNPDIDPDVFARDMNARGLPGVTFRQKYWKQYYGAFANRQVKGVRILINDMSVYQPYLTCLTILESLNSLYPNANLFPENKSSGFNRAAGTDEIFKKIKAGVPADVIIESYQEKFRSFMELRSRYLLYK